MAQNPPPGPGWTLGDDGHWKPPPLFAPRPTAGPPGAPLDPGQGEVSADGPWPPPSGTGGVEMPAAPSPWDPAGPTGTTGPAGPAGGMAGHPTWTGSPLPGSPSTGSSTVRTVLIVLGSVAAGGVALVMLLVGAVVFLGSSSESTFEPIDGQAIPTDPDDRGTSTPVGPPIGDSGDDPEGSTGTMLDDAVGGIDLRLEDAGWEPESDQRIVDGPNGGQVCVGPPPGARSGRALTWSHPDLADVALPGVPGLAVEIHKYSSADATADALGTLTSEAWRACLTDLMTRSLPEGTTGHLELMPGDRALPGVTYAIVIEGPGGAVTTTHSYVPVGSMLAYVFGCGCDADLERAAAREVAAALAQAQDLPTPG